ncbi:MAG: hypothetical protein CVT84_15690 [Alphaproteobacteria bacterium HGW-Alphaproteobacteria-6]|nr:MAG: hypothetical protein CVT84_15690 [Alphaproteobacteria bacterium HGW-Alphaproteobacteria-6]
MIWLLVILAAILASEALWRLPLMARVREVTAASRKAGRVLASKRISDHWKERVLPAYAWRIGRGSVGFFVLLCLGLLPAALPGLVLPGGLAAWATLLMRPAVIALLCAVSLGYLWIRSRATDARPGRAGAGAGAGGRGGV